MTYGLKNSRFKQGFIFTALLFATSCTQFRYFQTGTGQALNSGVQKQFPWGEVYCGQGTVCAEVEVVRVHFEDKNQGKVEVTLHNRTGSDVVVQIGLEILNDKGARLDSTTMQDFPLPARQEGVWYMNGVYQKNAKIRVILRARP